MSLYVKVDEAAQMVGVSASTIKKYYLMVEDKGYRFQRNNQGQLMFSNRDVEMFKAIIHLKSEPGNSVQKAVEQVVASITDVTPYEERNEESPGSSAVTTEDMKAIRSYMERQDKINELLLSELKATKEYIVEKLDTREETLLLTLQESQEQVKKLVEEAEQDGEKWRRLVTGKLMDAPVEKKKWWQIFN